MTLITPEQDHLIHRFMFISLLNLGAATVCLTLIGAWAIATAAVRFHLMRTWGSALFTTVPSLDPTILIGGVVAAYVFFNRRGEFYERAINTPFAMAMVKMSDGDSAAMSSSATNNSQPTVYLAGGTRTNWQDAVLADLPGWRVIDPRTHGLKGERDYSLWDLEGIRKSDWVLAYFESTNPGGYNLALEIGFAKAHGKHIILVDEKSESDENVRRYTGMLRASADATHPTVAAAVPF